ncbi:MAG: 50S ribosomal protein L10 [Candidatus Jorgensenbacteria bacterium]|nr:50S ribosomal protein L10 [Candidatus Jorgensenbacteria bacterium]
MKTKKQKTEAIESGLEDLKKSKTVIITDFTGLSSNEMNALRRALRAIETPFRVVKKRLLKIIFEKSGAPFDTKQYEGQTGVVFSPKDIVEVAGTVYRFVKEHEKKGIFKILGGLDVAEKRFIDAKEVVAIGKLPSREILLGQLVGMIAAPIKSFMFILKAKSEKSS